MIGLLGEALQCPSVSELHLNLAKIVLDSFLLNIAFSGWDTNSTSSAASLLEEA